MVIWLLLNVFNTLITFILGLLPVVETPAWLVTHLPEIFTMIFAFDQYLPIVDAFVVVVYLILFNMSYKIGKIVLNKFGINLSM